MSSDARCGRDQALRDQPERAADAALGDLAHLGGRSATAGGDAGRVLAGEQRAEHGDAERAAELAGRVVRRRAHAGPVARHGRHQLGRHRRHRQRHAGGEDAHRDDELRVRRVDVGRAPTPTRPTATSSSPADADPVGAEAGDELRRLRGDRHHHDRDRQQPHGGAERRVAEHALQVLGEQEERPEHGEEHERDAARRHGEAGVLEQAQVEHRVAVAPLPEARTPRARRPRRRTTAATRRSASRGAGPR